MGRALGGNGPFLDAGRPLSYVMGFPVPRAGERDAALEQVNIRFLENPGQAELSRLLSLYRENGWWENSDEPELAAEIVAGSHAFVVAEHQGTIIGMGRAISDRASDAYIQDLTVDPAFRGQGVGEQIVRALIQRLNEDGLFWIALIAEEGSEDFYKGLGFYSMAGATPMRRLVAPPE